MIKYIILNYTINYNYNLKLKIYKFLLHQLKYQDFLIKIFKQIN